MGIPTKLHGYPVRAFAYRGAGSYYLLIERPEGHPHPWVAATWAGGRDWHWGHYCDTRDEALTIYPEAAWLCRKTHQVLNPVVVT